MRFLELYLKAFGPFTGVTLDVSEGNEGLHVIYGPNEAGKSSALRAVHALLFGIHGQTPDNFVHDYTDLRIGARLTDADGEAQMFWRRKGSKATLLDESEEPVDDGRLTRLLGGITEPVFRDAFGIDHTQLVAGGETLLAGGGEVGESLFSAGLGSSHLRDLRHALDSESEALFRGGAASKPTINRLLRQYKDHAKATKEASLSGAVWTEARRASERAERERDRLDAKLKEEREAHSRLERLSRNLPRLARRADRQIALDRLVTEGPVPTLRDEFADERRAAERTQEKSTEKAERAAGEIQAREGLLADLEVPEDLLAREEEVEALRLAQDRHVKAAEDRVRLEAKRQRYESSAAEHLQELNPGAGPNLTKAPELSIAERARIQELIDDHAELAATLSSAARAEAKHRRVQTRLAAELKGKTEPPDPADLVRALENARRLGDLAERLAEHEEAEAEAQRQADLAWQRLGLFEGSLEEAEALAVPSLATVERFEADWDEATKTQQELATRREAVQREIEGQAKELSALESGRTVPTEEDLADARAHREEGWRLVRRAWLEGEDLTDAAYGTDQDLPGAYEHAVSRADTVADDLRSDADRVAAKAQLVARRKVADASATTLDAKQVQDTARHEQMQAEWLQVWNPLGVTPLQPREMRTWLERHLRLVERVEALRKAKAARTRMSLTIDAQRAAVLAALRVFDVMVDGEEFATLDALLDHAEAKADALRGEAVALKDLRTRLEDVEGELEEAQSEREAAEAELAAWRMNWAEAVAALALDGGATPEQARAVLQLLADLRTDLKEEEAYAKRIRAIDLDATVFADAVKSIVAAVAPDLASEDPHSALRVLTRRAKAAVDANNDRRRIAKELGSWLEEQDTEQEKATGAQRTLDALCREAGAEAQDALPAIEKRAQEAAAIKRDIDGIEDELMREGKGASLAELAKEAEGVDGDALAAELEAMEQAIADLEGGRDAVGVQFGKASQALASIEGTAEAANRAEEAEGVASEIRVYAEQYARLRLARAVLQREIERYRAANQAPLLRRAKEIFAAITCGSFAALESSYAEGDQPVLLGIRPSGERLRVESMSDGTREQLYLALRLASLEQHLEAGTAVPLVVDDLLLRSDEERSRAILAALADLSVRTQVLFFTHQRRFVDLAEDLHRPDAVFVHRLRRPAVSR